MHALRCMPSEWLRVALPSSLLRFSDPLAVQSRQQPALYRMHVVRGVCCCGAVRGATWCAHSEQQGRIFTVVRHLSLQLGSTVVAV